MYIPGCSAGYIVIKSANYEQEMSVIKKKKQKKAFSHKKSSRYKEYHRGKNIGDLKRNLLAFLKRDCSYLVKQIDEKKIIFNLNLIMTIWI